MKRKVYSYLLRTYGKLPLLWIGIAAEIIRTLVQRILAVIIIAHVATNVTAGDFTAAKHNIYLFIGVYAITAALGTLGELLSMYTTDRKYEELLLIFYKKITNKDISFYRDHQTGYLSSLFRQHLDSSMALVRLFRTNIINTAVSLTVPVIVLWISGWQIGVVVAVVVILQSSYVIWSSGYADKYRKPAQEVYRSLTGEVADEMTNAVAFKSSGTENEAMNKVRELAHKEAELFWQRHSTTAIFDLPRVVLTAFGIGAGFLLALQGGSSPQAVGILVLTFGYMFQIMRNTADLPDLIQRSDEHVARVYPTLEYLTDSYEEIRDKDLPKPLNITSGIIDINHVDFGYKIGGSISKNVFTDLTLHIKGGEHVGIVGVSGVGKSTLASLVMRFDEVTAGSITIDGIDIRDVRQNELHQKIAYVPQEPILFHRSIRDNIAYFKKSATDEEIKRAARIAHIDKFIEGLPQGYDTLVGERGMKLSGGQKQRVVIARIVLKNAPIIIFDEATSALDSESEQIIQTALPVIIGKHTAIIIAHRLSTIAKLDRIIVMHEGKILEQGTHVELLAQNGRYKSLYENQN